MFFLVLNVIILLTCLKNSQANFISRFEFEKVVGGPGSSRSPWRSNASSASSLRMFEGESIHVDLCLTEATAIKPSAVLYSNDGLPDTIGVNIDSMYEFGPVDTGETLGGWGNDWNEFTTHNISQPSVGLDAGNHVLVFEVLSADCYGTELDAVDLMTNIPVDKDAFVCGSKLIRSANPSSCAQDVDSAMTSSTSTKSASTEPASTNTATSTQPSSTNTTAPKMMTTKPMSSTVSTQEMTTPSSTSPRTSPMSMSTKPTPMVSVDSTTTQTSPSSPSTSSMTNTTSAQSDSSPSTMESTTTTTMSSTKSVSISTANATKTTPMVSVDSTTTQTSPSSPSTSSMTNTTSAQADSSPSTMESTTTTTMSSTKSVSISTANATKTTPMVSVDSTTTQTSLSSPSTSSMTNTTSAQADSSPSTMESTTTTTMSSTKSVSISTANATKTTPMVSVDSTTTQTSPSSPSTSSMTNTTSAQADSSPSTMESTTTTTMSSTKSVSISTTNATTVVASTASTETETTSRMTTKSSSTTRSTSTPSMTKSRSTTDHTANDFVKQMSFSTNCITSTNVRIQFKPTTLNGVQISARNNPKRQTSFRRRMSTDEDPKICRNQIWQIGKFNNDYTELGPIRYKNIDHDVNAPNDRQMPFPGLLNPQFTRTVTLRYVVPKNIDLGKGFVYLSLGLVDVNDDVTVGLQYHIRRKRNPSKVEYVTITPENSAIGWDLPARAVSPSLENIITLYFNKSTTAPLKIDFIRLESLGMRPKLKKANIARTNKWRVRAFSYKPHKKRPTPEGMKVTIDGGNTVNNTYRVIIYRKPFRKALTIYKNGRIFPVNQLPRRDDDSEGTKLTDITGFVFGNPEQDIATVNFDTAKGIVTIRYDDGSIVRFTVTYNKFRTKLAVIESTIPTANIELLSTYITHYVTAVNKVLIGNTKQTDVKDRSIEDTKNRRYTFVKTTPNKMYKVNDDYELLFPKNALP